MLIDSIAKSFERNRKKLNQLLVGAFQKELQNEFEQLRSELQMFQQSMQQVAANRHENVEEKDNN